MSAVANRDNLARMSSEEFVTPFAAAVYGPDTEDRAAMHHFAVWLGDRGVRIGGLLQEAVLNAAGEVVGLNAIDGATGDRTAITRPVQQSDECTFDIAALTEATGIIRHAIEQRVDLVLVEKFGEKEQEGQGLMDEVLQTIAEGIPLLIAVPAAALPLWQERTGELGSVLEFEQSAFEQWWQGLKPRGA